MSSFDERPWLRTLGLTVTESVPLEPSTPLQDLADTVATHPDTAAWSHYGQSATYAEFDRQTTAFAAYLAESGIRPGDAVAVSSRLTALPDRDLRHLEGRGRRRPPQPHVPR